MNKVSCRVPGGAFYVFVNIRETGMNAEEFTKHLIREAHVAVVPGTAFGSHGEGYVRLSYAVSMENLERVWTESKKPRFPLNNSEAGVSENVRGEESLLSRGSFFWYSWPGKEKGMKKIEKNVSGFRAANPEKLRPRPFIDRPNRFLVRCELEGRPVRAFLPIREGCGKSFSRGPSLSFPKTGERDT